MIVNYPTNLNSSGFALDDNNIGTATTPRDVEPGFVKIKIEAGTTLIYKNNFTNTDGKIRLVHDHEFCIPEGSQIIFSKNEYCVVHTFYEVGHRYPTVSKSAKMILQIGTEITQDNGISVKITKPLEVTLLSYILIKLLPQTKLFQRSTATQIVLQNEAGAILI
jgi:hypothetical protein